MKYGGCERILVRDKRAKEFGHGNLYLNNVTDILQNSFEFCCKQDIIFHPERNKMGQK